MPQLPIASLSSFPEGERPPPELMAGLVRVGEVLGGRYQLTEVLGVGGMGAVFAAIHKGTGREVAIKVLLLQHGNRHHPDRVTRFVREASAAGRIRHPNVVDVYDVDGTSDTPYIVMERLHGESLGQRIRRGVMATDDALTVMIGAMNGVAEAHRRGVIHRDLKPDNIYLACAGEGPDLVPKVLDFGVSRIVEREGAEPRPTTITRRGYIVGTPSYMPLEQLRGEPTVDARADVYALGVILYEALCGERPYQAHNDHELVILMVTQPPIPLSQKVPAVDVSLARIVGKALAREAKDRFQDVDGFRDALERWLAGERNDDGGDVVGALAKIGRRRAGLTFLMFCTLAGIVMYLVAVPATSSSLLGGNPSRRDRALSEARMLVANPAQAGGQTATDCYLPASEADHLRACITKRVEMTILELHENQDRIPITFAAQVGSRMLRDHALLAKALARADGVVPILRKELVGARMPPLLHYLALIESGYDPLARSPAGAYGLWQFKADTARQYGLRVDSQIDEREDPIKSTRAASQHLRDLAFEFGGDALLLALASYNLGEGGIRRALQKLDDPFSDRSYWTLVEKGLIPRETALYVTRFVAASIAGEAGLPSREALLAAGYRQDG